MNANFDFEKLKSINFTKNYENRDKNYKTIDSINAEALKEKLLILENNIKYSITNKNNQDFNINSENKIYNNNLISNYLNTRDKNNDGSEANESINNSIKLMDIKLNHQILQNKIENMRKTLIKEGNDNNYNTISINNDLDHNPLNKYNYLKNNVITPKNYDNRINFNEKIISREKENNLNFNNLSKENKNNPIKNNYLTSNNFYNQRDQFNTIHNQFSERSLKNDYGTNIGTIDRKYDLLTKTIGNFEYQRNSILPKFNINNNEMKLDYTKKDVADLDGKILNTKKKLNNRIHRAETIIVDKKNKNKIFDKDMLNDNKKQFTKYKTLDSKRLRDYKDFDESDHSYEIAGGDRINFRKYNNKKDNKMNFKDLEEIYEAEKIPYKNAKSKNFDSYRKNSSSEISMENFSGEKINRGVYKNQESYSTLNPKKTLNQIDYRDDYQENKRLKSKLIKNNPETTSDRGNRMDKNRNYNDSQSNNSSSRNGKKNQNQNQHENLYTVHTISNNNNNNNTINIMDSLRISENSEEDLDDNNLFLRQDQSSHIQLNISGIAADLISIQNENARAVERIRENDQYFPIEEEIDNKNLKEKGNYKKKHFADEAIESNLYSGVQHPVSKENRNNKYLNLQEKKSLNHYSNLKSTKQLDNISDNLTPRSRNNQSSMNNEQLKNIGNSISPIKNSEKVKFTEKEIEELVSKYLEQNTSKDPPNNINLLKNFSKNFSLKSTADKNKLKNLILNEFKNDKSFNIESEITKDNYALRGNESQNNSNIDGDYNLLVGTGFKPKSEKDSKRNDYFKSEKDKKLRDVFNKIPEIISEFKDRKGKVNKDNSESGKPNTQFFNMNNLGKWIDLSKTNLWKNDSNNITNGDSNLNGKDILNEADNIINNHVLKMKKKNNFKENHNSLDLQDENIIREVNQENRKPNNIETKAKQNLARIPSRGSNEESKETLDNKIGYVYDLLKNFSYTKLKDLITNQVEVKEKISREEIKNNLNESTRVRDEMQRFSNKENLANKKFENEIEYNIRKEENDILFSDNKKISFEIPKGPMRLREEEESHLNDEFKQSEVDEHSPDLLLSPQTKSVLENNINQLSNDLIQGDISEFKNIDLSKSGLNARKIKKEDPFEIIEKREEKFIENNFVIEKPEITESPQKRDMFGTKLKKKTTLNKGDTNKNINLKAIDNGIKENPMGSNVEKMEQEQDEEEFQVVSISKKIDFSDKNQAPGEKKPVSNELRKGNKDKEYEDLEENAHDHEEESCAENEEQDIYSEEEPRSLDNCINKLNNSSNQKEENHHVNFQTFLHSNSAKIISSRNFKGKNAENLRTDFENGIEENQRHNHSDLELENEKIDEEIKTELNKNVISDIPYTNGDQKNKVKFSEKLVFIEYEEESLAENIKVYNQNGKPEKHNKFNLLKYLIRIKNNKYKSKKILRYYYNGIRDDRIPKKLLSNLKRTNSFNEEDKELGLKKLNEFLNECNKENQLSDVKEQQKKRIVERNINTIHEIEEARKKGVKIKRVRSPTPKKIVQSHVCKKFKGDPNKFFSKNPPNSLLKVFNIPINNSELKSVRSIGKFSERIFNKTNNDKRLSGITTNDKDKIDKSKNKNENKLHEFNLNSDASQKNQKEKELNNIISNINLEESMNSFEQNSNIFKESELLHDITSLNSYVQSPEKITIQ